MCTRLKPTLAVEVEIDAPEGGAEGVGEAWSALVVEGVGLAEDERRDGGVGVFDLVVGVYVGRD